MRTTFAFRHSETRQFGRLKLQSPRSHLARSGWWKTGSLRCADRCAASHNGSGNHAGTTPRPPCCVPCWSLNRRDLRHRRRPPRRPGPLMHFWRARLLRRTPITREEGSPPNPEYTRRRGDRCRHRRHLRPPAACLRADSSVRSWETNHPSRKSASAGAAKTAPAADANAVENPFTRTSHP